MKKCWFGFHRKTAQFITFTDRGKDSISEQYRIELFTVTVCQCGKITREVFNGNIYFDTRQELKDYVKEYSVIPYPELLDYIRELIQC